MGLLVVLAAAGAVYQLGLYDKLHLTMSPTTSPCPTATASPSSQPAATGTAQPPKPQQVSLVLLNGTSRNGLAKSVGEVLVGQGFVVRGESNAPAALSGASTVTYGPGAQPAATVLGHWVLGARLVANSKAPRGSLRVVLGSGFRRLATPAQVAAAAAAPSATPSPTASACPA
ncbi:MAG: LytR cell envelope-related transcriptional attenuator [Frankiales bacterium]|nr:LytR cell envelope-related transcriptional attenuator [Frankiales bacterium]